MIEEYKKLIIDDIHETELEFCFYNNDGMNFIQASQIYVLAKKYLKKYPGVGISKICDCYSYYSHNTEFSEYKYMHCKDGEQYRDKDYMAFYSWDDRAIVFNHILCKELELDDMSLMRRSRITENLFVGDKMQIKIYERVKTIRTIFIHEFAHAIENQFHVYDDKRIKNLFENNNKTGIFKDIHEFIAECFVVNEYFPINKTVNKVMKIIEEYNQNISGFLCKESFEEM